MANPAPPCVLFYCQARPSPLPSAACPTRPPCTQREAMCDASMRHATARGRRNTRRSLFPFPPFHCGQSVCRTIIFFYFFRYVVRFTAVTMSSICWHTHSRWRAIRDNNRVVSQFPPSSTRQTQNGRATSTSLQQTKKTTGGPSSSHPASQANQFDTTPPPKTLPGAAPPSRGWPHRASARPPPSRARGARPCSRRRPTR